MRDCVRGILTFASLLGCALFVTNSHAQVYYSFPGATVIEKDFADVGTAIGFGDNVTRLLGYGRFNVSQVSDLGLEVVMDNTAGTWRLGAGVDFRYLIVPTSRELPFDLSVGAGLGFESGAHFSNIDIPVGGMISRPLELDNGHILLPFAGFYVVYTNVHSDRFGNDADLEVELRAGSSYELTRMVRVFAAASFGGRDTMFFLGVNARL